MSAQIAIQGVHAIRVDAYTVPGRLDDGGNRHCQVLTVLDAHGWPLGEVTLWLDSPNAALPIGDRARLDPSAADMIDWPL